MQMEEVIITADNCRYCLMCRHVTPVGHVTHRETLTPHGWGLLIASAHRGLVEWNESAVEALYAAADVGVARAHCVTDQPFAEMVAAQRTELVKKQQAPVEVYRVQETLEKWGTPYAQETDQPAVGQGEAAVFVGDEWAYLWPEAGEAAVRLLQASGVDPVRIGIGRSSGFLASSLGLPDVALKLARETLAELKATGAKRLFVLSAGDYFTFHQLYDERLGIPWPEEVEIIEVSVFLHEQLETGAVKFTRQPDAAPYAYIDPTHAVRVPGRHAAPRALLAAASSGEPRELFWNQDRGHPAGTTGVRFTTPEVAEKLTRARLQDAQDVGAETIYCEDPATLAELAKYAGDYNLTLHGLYEYLVENLASGG